MASAFTQGQLLVYNRVNLRAIGRGRKERMDELQADNSDSGSEDALTYVAHYLSPTNSSPVKGFFEFDSIYRASSKQNLHDARVRMLEIFGKEAVSWVIDDVKLKKRGDRVCSEQLELDFRNPKPVRKRPKPKKYL